MPRMSLVIFLTFFSIPLCELEKLIFHLIKFFCDFRYLHDGLHYLLHYLDAHKLVRAVEVDTAGEDVRTRQTLEAQLGSVGTAADRLYTRRNAALLHRSEHDVDDVLILEDILAIVMMVMLSAIAGGSNPDGEQMLGSIVKIGFFLVLWFIVGIFSITWMLTNS